MAQGESSGVQGCFSCDNLTGGENTEGTRGSKSLGSQSFFREERWPGEVLIDKMFLLTTRAIPELPYLTASKMAHCDPSTFSFLPVGVLLNLS